MSQSWGLTVIYVGNSDDDETIPAVGAVEL